MKKNPQTAARTGPTLQVNSSVAPVRVALQNAASAAGLPGDEHFRRWVNCTIDCAGQPLADNSCVTIRVVDEAESSTLNELYRHIASPTNVLAFPVAHDEYPAGDDGEIELGDLVVCADVVLREAREQAKSADAHFAHMTVHGSLHLLGYDHLTEQEAVEMETLEKQVMAKLGFPDPYRDDNQDLAGA
jgi:probable rRNA maturation factor